ncbi:MAG: FG-GAP repeat protein [Planctomycetes bacterium]|nr:FG-GAP repeat protein [Planctomycetota bacterium]
MHRKNLLSMVLGSLALLVVAGSASAQVTTLHRMDGLAKGHWCGFSVAGVGDVNQDGCADLAVGAPGASPGGRGCAGQVRIFSGKDGSTVFTFDGLATGDYLGWSVAGAGDVNRDGFPDILVGAYLADPPGRMSAGQATVFSGKDGSVLYRFDGLTAGETFGSSVAGAGDVNRDGYADIMVGAFRASTYTGQATVFSGKDGAVLHRFSGKAAGIAFGAAVGGAGDVNRDGYDDLIVSDSPASWLTSETTVFSGRDGTVLHLFKGAAPGNGFGLAVAGAGDVNRDGYPDLIVGAYLADPGGRTDAGETLVFSGKDGITLHTFSGVAAGDGLGCSVAGAGDVDKDGYPDLIVGAPLASPGGRTSAGQATLFSRKDGTVLCRFDGLAAGDVFGRSVASAGDVNRDLFPDLMVGAQFADPGGRTDAGQATVFSLAAWVISGSGSPRIGGTITLDLLAPGDQILPFQIGSSLGSGPIVIGNRTLGLSGDGLLLVSVSGFCPGIFQGYRGVIDNQCQARAAIGIPNHPTLIGVRIHTAFVTLDPNAPAGIKSISNTFSFTITT